MKGLCLIFALLAFTAAQKPHKGGIKQRPAYHAPSPGDYGGGQSHYDGPSYHHAPQQAQKYSGGNGNSLSAEKPSYPLLIADERTLNQDGTINFNFQADNGLQQGETVDPDGTRRGFYSYPGADGKIITVKYTAGKNGFVAEGDHLPLQPQSAPHREKDEADQAEYNAAPRPQKKHQKTHYDSGHYNHQPQTNHYSRPAPPPPQHHYSGPPASAPRPRPAAPARPSYEGPGPNSHYSSPYSSGGASFIGYGDDDGDDGFPRGFPSSPPNNFQGSPTAPKPRPAYSSPSGPSHGGRYPSGPNYAGASHAPVHSRPTGGFTADNPYQPAGAGPFNGKFDLGNNGHFSINFAPGAAQEYQPQEGPSYSPSTPVYVGTKPGSGRRQQGFRPSGPRGTY